MTKRLCDLCGKPADKELVGVSLSYKQKVLSDKTARIMVRINLGFMNHSTGFGGPPDLCKPCLLNTVDALRDYLRK